jgi:hypothetical protein
LQRTVRSPLKRLLRAGRSPATSTSTIGVCLPQFGCKAQQPSMGCATAPAESRPMGRATALRGHCLRAQNRRLQSSQSPANNTTQRDLENHPFRPAPLGGSQGAPLERSVRSTQRPKAQRLSRAISASNLAMVSSRPQARSLAFPLLCSPPLDGLGILSTRPETAPRLGTTKPNSRSTRSVYHRTPGSKIALWRNHWLNV